MTSKILHHTTLCATQFNFITCLLQKNLQNQPNFYTIFSLHILTKNVCYALPHDTQSKQINFKTLACASKNLIYRILIYNF